MADRSPTLTRGLASVFPTWLADGGRGCPAQVGGPDMAHLRVAWRVEDSKDDRDGEAL